MARNLIYGLTTASNSTAAEVNGIRVAGGTTVYRNNMIALGAGIANAIGAVATNAGSTGINGIYEALGTNSFFHNSVYIGGSPTAGTGASYAFNGTQTAATRSFRDNVFFNARSNSGATGKNYAVKINGTAPNPAGLTINNNVYFANGSGGVFGFFNSLDVPNLGTWRTNVGQDSGSIEGNPAYNDPANATPDLHIHPTNPTVIEANGVDVGVTDDFDGQTRSGLTPVDIGADAGNFNGIDLTAPVISYTPLGNTDSTANRPLSSTITDATSGVPTAGIGLPVIYYRKGVVGAFSSTQATFGGGSTYNFTIDYTLVGGVVIGDTIQYYVAAQDGAATPNVTTNPVAGASGFTANPPAAATPPTPPNSYQIVTPISGLKTVCASGCDFTTLTGATGIFNAINTSVATGNLEIQIAGDLVVGEDGTSGLNALSENPSGSNFTVKIYPTGAARAITGSFAGALIRLRGSSRVTIDGSIGGIGTDRSLTITNTSVTTPTVILFGSVGATPVTSDTLKNCVVINGANTSSAVVISDATVLGNAGVFSNITIQNNDVQRAFVGVFATGGTTPQGGSNLIYTQNTVNTSGALAIRNVGLYMQGVLGATVSQNTVGNFSNTEGENDTGIWLATGTGNATVSGNTVNNLGMTLTTAFAPFGIRESSGLAASGNNFSGNTVTNLSTTGGTGLRGIAVQGGGVTLQSNKIQGIINNNTGTFGSFGIDVVAGNDAVIKNNFVSDLNHNMTGGAAFGPDFGVVGIRLGAGTGHKVYNNSVNLFGPHTGTATTSLLSAAFSISTTAQTGIDVRDNIFANNITGGTTSIAHVSVFLPSGGGAAMNLTWNNNAYFFGTDVARQGVGQAGTTAGTNFFTTLPALAAYTSTLSGAGTNDNASQASTGAVPFLTATDLHLQPTSPLASAGVPLAGVTTDIDNETRSLTAPSIGADEVVADLSITKTDGVTTATPGGGVTYTITASNAGPGPVLGVTVADTFPAVLSCTWTCVGAGGGSCAASGVGSINDATVNLPVSGSVTYTATCSISSAATGSLSNTATVSSAVPDPAPANNSATDTDTLTPSADLAITKTDGVTTATPGGSVTYTITASNAGPSNATGATVADTFPAIVDLHLDLRRRGRRHLHGVRGSGNINDTVNLPLGGSVTYTASCTINRFGHRVAFQHGDRGCARRRHRSDAGQQQRDRHRHAGAVGRPRDHEDRRRHHRNARRLGNLHDRGLQRGPQRRSGRDGGGHLPRLAHLQLDVRWRGRRHVLGQRCAATSTTRRTCRSAAARPTRASCSIATSATGSVVNTATVASPGGVTDPRPGNNSATDTDTLAGQADTSLNMTVSNSTPTVGSNVTYTVSANNNGPSDAHSVVVTDLLPNGLTFVSATPSQGSYTSGTGAWAVGTIADNGTVTLALVATVNSSQAIVNQASVTAQTESDPNRSNNSALISINGAGLADVQLQETVDDDTPGNGQNVTFTVSAHNDGPTTATNVVVTDNLPSGLTFVSATPSQGTYTSGTGTWNVGTIASGATPTLTVVATVTTSSPVFRIVQKTQTEPDYASDNDTDSVSLNDNTVADLAMSLVASQEPVPQGTTFTYTIVVSNHGPATATSVVVTDSLPAGLTFVSATATQGSCTGTTNVSCNLGSLADGNSANIALVVTKTVGGNVSNTASVAATESDPFMPNNSNSETSTPAELTNFRVE